LINAVPNPVLGGVTTFLFASVAVSGIRVLSYISFTRRDRFVLAAALSCGIGDLLVPSIFTHLFDRVKNPNKGLQGFFDSITILLSTPCEFYKLYSLTYILINIIGMMVVLISGIVAVLLNQFLPQEMAEIAEQESVEVIDSEKQDHKD